MDSRIASRRSEKWTKYPPDVLPAWVAEMDFDLAPPVRDALIAAVELGDLGYIGNVDGLLASLEAFMQRRLGWTVGDVALVCDVMVGFKELVAKVTVPGDGEELVPLGGARAVHPAHVGVGQGEEVVPDGVQEVRGARAEALVGQLQRAHDLVARRLDPDALAAEVHAVSIGGLSRRL